MRKIIYYKHGALNHVARFWKDFLTIYFNSKKLIFHKYSNNKTMHAKSV